MKLDLSAMVVDDEPQIRHFIAEILRGEGWSVSEAADAEEAFEIFDQKQWTLVFCDVNMGGIDSYEVLRRFKLQQPKIRFVLMTGYGSAVGALDATNIGAYDYLVKPFVINDVLKIASGIRALIRPEPRPAAPAKKEYASPAYISNIELIGQAPKFVECLKMVGRVAATNLPILVSGESGTGKEVVARAIHARSTRADKPFVAVNCGAIPVELIESELFGHTKGSFSGADRERIGLWEEADGGTIFLDEITETSALFQVKVLRALQQGEIRRVGSNQTLKVNVRVIAATNRKIEEEVQQGRFRQDLMYRLNAVTIKLPSLRERVEDIPALAEHFASKICGGTDKTITFSPEALQILKDYRWQGNVRELENAVFHAVSMSDQVVYPEHLPETLQNQMQIALKLSPEDGDVVFNDSQMQQWLTLSEIQAKYVAKALAFTGGNKQAAARLIGIDRKTLSRIAKTLPNT